MRQAFLSKENTDWPEESKVRAEYYLARTLIESNTHLEEAYKLDQEAKSTLRRLLKLEDPTATTNHREQDEYPILFEHLMPWEYRILVPSQAHER